MAADPSSRRRDAIRALGSLVVSGAALAAVLLLWAVASREPPGPNPGPDLQIRMLGSPFGLVGAGLLLAMVVLRSRLLARQDTGRIWFAVACALVVVNLLFCLWLWDLDTDGYTVLCDRRPLVPGLYVVSQALAVAGAGWSVRVASSATGRGTRFAALAAGIMGVGVLVLSTLSFASVLAAVAAPCTA
jgi:hypothetical protein